MWPSWRGYKLNRSQIQFFASSKTPPRKTKNDRRGGRKLPAAPEPTLTYLIVSLHAFWNKWPSLTGTGKKKTGGSLQSPCNAVITKDWYHACSNSPNNSMHKIPFLGVSVGNCMACPASNTLWLCLCGSLTWFRWWISFQVACYVFIMMSKLKARKINNR